MKRFLIISVLAVCAAAATAVERVYVAVDTVARVITLPVDSSARSVTAEVRVAVGRRPWRLSGDGWTVTVVPKDVYADMLLSEPSVEVTVAAGDSVVARREFSRVFSAVAGTYNSLAVTIRNDSTLNVRGGTTAMASLFAGVRVPGAFGRDCRLESDEPMKIAVAVTETVADPARALQTRWTPELIAARLDKSDDPVEGVWEFLDRENDPRRARPGGRYRLALLADGAGGYEIIYLAGAEVNGREWKPGMLKGRLRPTPFVGHFDLVWVDAMMQPIEHDISASVEEALMTLGFPLMKSRMRFSRQPAGN